MVKLLVERCFTQPTIPTSNGLPTNTNFFLPHFSVLYRAPQLMLGRATGRFFQRGYTKNRNPGQRRKGHQNPTYYGESPLAFAVCTNQYHIVEWLVLGGWTRCWSEFFLSQIISILCWKSGACISPCPTQKLVLISWSVIATATTFSTWLWSTGWRKCTI